MNVPWRIWVLFLTLLATLFAGVGMQPGLSGAWWPVAGLWLAAGLSAYGLSIWASMCLVFHGVLLDLMTDAPIGAWPLALLLAYVVGVVAWDRHPPIKGFVVEAVAVVGGLIAASLALAVAAGVAGYEGFTRSGFIADFMITAILYLPIRLILLPGEVREAKR